MGEDTNHIEREIVAERDRLGRNLNELEMKARQLADWRTHYRNNPKLLLGIAFGGGLVLGAIAGRGRSSRDHDSCETGGSRLPRPRGRAGRQIADGWQNISEVLLGVASAKVMAFVSSIVPGFSEQLHHRSSGSGEGQQLEMLDRPHLASGGRQ